MTAMKFRNCKPHYLWLPLKRKAGDRELSVGELHLRVQWTSDELERPQEALPTWALDIQLRGVGLSVIEAKMLNFPREARLLLPCPCSYYIGRLLIRCSRLVSLLKECRLICLGEPLLV